MITLEQKQKYPLEVKEMIAQRKILEFVDEFGVSGVYVSFSGGKDSRVLLHMVRTLFPEVKAMFVDTGLEFPEIRNFVKTQSNVDWTKPKLNFKQVIDKYGFPVVSKEQSQYISELRNTKSEKLRNTRLFGNKAGRGKVSKKWMYLVKSDIKISHKCCYYLKKQPSELYEKETGRHPIIGTMAKESQLRKQQYKKHGCNAFDIDRPISKPLSIWTDKDIWEYIKKYNLEYSEIYDKGMDRTGCMFCMYGIHKDLEDQNRFLYLEKYHPKLYYYCIHTLGCGKVLDLLGVQYSRKQDGYQFTIFD